MKESPILFNTEMVRAILDGHKAQSRRIIKPQPALLGPKDIPLLLYDNPKKAGDRLWVRETWRVWEAGDEPDLYLGKIRDYPWPGRNDLVECAAESMSEGPWRPSIFMPRWASRITLEITDLRVQRIQEISEEDIFAEGLCGTSTVDSFSQWIQLWDSINAKRGYSWDSNPWVWAYTFKKL